MIRGYREEDKQAVEELLRDSAYPQPTLSKLDDPHYEKFVYEEESVRGIIILHVPYLTLEIFHLRVDKGFRGQGIGTDLLEFALDLCQEKNLDGVRVYTDSENEEARRFYRRRGFENAGKVENFDVEGEPSIFFYKSVSKE